MSGAALLTVTYLLVEHQYTQHGDSLFIATSGGPGFGGGSAVLTQAAGVVHGTTGALPRSVGSVGSVGSIEAQAHVQSAAALNQLLINSGIALGLMALISIWLGWLVAGRALRPLRTMTNTARQISASNLHRRLDLKGPDD